MAARKGRPTLGFGPCLQQQFLYFVEPGNAFKIDQGSLTGILYPKAPTTNLTGKSVFSSHPESMKWWMSAPNPLLLTGP